RSWPNVSGAPGRNGVASGWRRQETVRKKSLRQDQAPSTEDLGNDDTAHVAGVALRQKDQDRARLVGAGGPNERRRRQYARPRGLVARAKSAGQDSHARA